VRRLAIAVAVASLAAAGGVGLFAQETRSATLLTTEHWLDWERVSDAQIAPDGSRIVFTRQHVNKLEDKWDSELWIVNADGSQQRFLVKGGAPRWSPDGKRLLYQAEGEPKGSQLFVRWIDADGPATQITHISEAPRNAKWSPDGKTIAFSEGGAIVLIDVENGEEETLTDPDNNDSSPAWAPRTEGEDG
jgi:Tol biopolymer transport system component